MSRNKPPEPAVTRTADSVNVTAHGQNWDEIRADARRIACMPSGHVTLFSKDTTLCREYEHSTGRAVPTGRMYATVTVTPCAAPQEEMPPGDVTYYTEDMIRSALTRRGYATVDAIMTAIREGGSLCHDNRFSIAELNRAHIELFTASGPDYFTKHAVQALKNRVWDAHGCQTRTEP